MLAALSLLLYVPLGILLGVIAALQEDKLADQVISGLSMAFVGLPEFVTGLLLIAVLAISWRLLPANSSIDPDTTFREALPYLILPAITVSLTSLGYIARMTRASTIDVLRRLRPRGRAQGAAAAPGADPARAAQLAAAHGHGGGDGHRLADRRPDRHRVGVRLPRPRAAARLRHPAPRPDPDPGDQHGGRGHLYALEFRGRYSLRTAEP